MMKIFVDELEVLAIIGTLPEERLTPQRLLISLELDVETAEAEMNDDLAGTVDYAALCRQIEAHAQKAYPLLLEKLAAELVKLVSEEEKIQAAKVEIAKPAAISNARSVRVRKSWSR